MEFKDLSIESESERFLDHISKEDNHRLIFSGIFGIGKTYFLDKFFAPSSEEFITIKLNPINYAVSANEDVFELIKHDIAFQLFSKNPDFEKIIFNPRISAEYYLLNNYKTIIKSLAESLSKLDHRLDKIVKSILDLNEKVDEYKKEIEKDEKLELQNYLESFTRKIGTSREEDSITELLNKLINSLKEQNSDKKIVLVIDDLDRIDPEHIFRIMNVFSAHFDYYDQKDENKFGFHKVILVCDIENIRAIYHAKYGTEIDFSGYIDKFYSLEIFEYDNKEVITNNLGKFLKSIRNNQNGSNKIDFGLNGFIGGELEFVLINFVKSGVLSMRTLINFLKTELIIPEYTIKSGEFGTMNVYSRNTPILIIFHILEKLVGDKIELIRAFDKTIFFRPNIEFSKFMRYWNLKIGNVMLLVDYENSNFKISKDLYFFKDEELDLSVSYLIHNSSNFYGAMGNASRILFFKDNITESTYDQNDTILKTRVPYFQLMKKAYINMNHINKD